MLTTLVCVLDMFGCVLYYELKFDILTSQLKQPIWLLFSLIYCCTIIVCTVCTSEKYFTFEEMNVEKKTV